MTDSKYQHIHNNILNTINEVSTNEIKNYIVPGMYSYLFKQGKVRFFYSSREQDEYITPHNHSCNLLCIVLKGKVENIIYSHLSTVYPEAAELDYYAIVSYYKDSGGLGKYIEKPIPKGYKDADYIKKFTKRSYTYEEGDIYFLSWKEFHTIKFKKDTVVLIIESEQKQEGFSILLPYVDSKIINTFKIEDWMFEKSA